jgi:hypothetical protein
VVVAEKMQEAVDERTAPVRSDHLRAQDDVAQRPGDSCGQLLPAVKRERKDVRRLVDAEMIALQVPHLVRPDERDAELAVRHTLAFEHLPR